MPDAVTPPGAPAPAPAASVAIAGIDVGSTSVRMKIAERSPDGTLRPLEELVHPVALGVDTFRLGFVTPRTLRALGRVLANFAKVMRQYGVQHCNAVATSAIRDASNRDILVDRIRHESGVRLQILDAVGELRLTFQNLQPFLAKHLANSKSYALVLDLGGGSTEIMLLQGATLVLVGTRRLGTARLFQNVAAAGGENSRAILESIIRNMVESARDLYRAYTVTELVVINTQLAQALVRGKDARELEGGLAVTAAAVRKLAAEAGELSAAELSARHGVPPAQAELLQSAVLVVKRFLEHVEAKRVWLPELDLVSALIQEASARLSGVDELGAFREQVLRSAVSIGAKYRFDAQHAQHVARLAVQLYEGLAAHLDLGARERVYLEVAALLHDIGNFVSERAHHKHSAYLIRWSEIVGLTEEELVLVSQVARYHRKRHPAAHHLEFASLPLDERLRVTKLAALLRLADALDRGHDQVVRGLTVRMEDQELSILADAGSDLAVETMALQDKAKLFEEITGLAVRLRRREA